MFSINHTRVLFTPNLGVLNNCFERNKMKKKESHMKIYGDLNDP